MCVHNYVLCLAVFKVVVITHLVRGTITSRGLISQICGTLTCISTKISEENSMLLKATHLVLNSQELSPLSHVVKQLTTNNIIIIGCKELKGGQTYRPHMVAKEANLQSYYC